MPKKIDPATERSLWLDQQAHDANKARDEEEQRRAEQSGKEPDHAEK
jgi:hypothetical protein